MQPTAESLLRKLFRRRAQPAGWRASHWANGSESTCSRCDDTISSPAACALAHVVERMHSTPGKKSTNAGWVGRGLRVPAAPDYCGKQPFRNRLTSPMSPPCAWKEICEHVDARSLAIDSNHTSSSSSSCRRLFVVPSEPRSKRTTSCIAPMLPPTLSEFVGRCEQH